MVLLMTHRLDRLSRCVNPSINVALIKWRVDKVSTALRFFLPASMSDICEIHQPLRQEKTRSSYPKITHDFLTAIHQFTREKTPLLRLSERFSHTVLHRAGTLTGTMIAKRQHYQMATNPRGSAVRLPWLGSRAPSRVMTGGWFRTLHPLWLRTLLGHGQKSSL